MATGCYVEPYLPASFKGVGFVAIEADSNHGRRGAEGEFPFGEQTAYADLGRKIRTYNIRARFQENNHVLQSAALIAVCEAPGPGPLVHPTRGVILSAACKALRVTDKVEEEQGVTYLDLEFVEANNWPNGLSLIGQLLGLAFGAIIGTARANFRSSYNIQAIQSFRRQEVVEAAQSQIANIERFYSSTSTAFATDITRNRISYDLNMLATDYTLASNTDRMDEGLYLGMLAVSQNLSGYEKFRVFRDVANSAALSSSFSSPAADAEDAVYSLVRILSAVFMAEGALEAEEGVRVGEYYEAIDTIDAILSQEASFARQNCSNELYTEIEKFRTDALAQLYRRSSVAPGLVQYNFSSRVHPVVAAYSIFKDAKQHRQLESLNLVGNGGRFPSSVIALRP